MNRAWVQRGLNRLYIMVITPVKEKRFISPKGGEQLRYLFFRKKASPVLVVGFQACNNKGARYNYVATIRGIKANRLYIKDDFAENHRGNYYLGRNGTYSVETSVLELIDRYKEICNATKLIFIGSSKGGYAAINFGLCYKGSDMIVAAPQYYVGTYLNCDRFLPNLKDILGENIRQDQIFQLDGRLKDKIRRDTAGETQRVYIHYSSQEHTYEEHIKDLLRDLSAQGIQLQEDVGTYKNHEELKYYFPKYLCSCLEERISKRGTPDMKVLMIDHFLPGNTYVLELGRELKTYCDLSIFCRKHAGAQEEGITWIPQCYPGGRKKAAAVLEYGISLLKLAGTLWRGSYDVVHVQSFKHAAYGMKVCLWMRKCYKKLVCTVHNVLPHEADPGDWKLYKGFYDQCDELIVHNKTSKVCLMQQFQVPERKIAVIPHGSYQAPMIKNRTYKKQGVKQFLQFGVIRTYKGIDILLDAIALMKPEQRNRIHITIAGEQFPKLDGTDYPAKIRMLGIEEWVSFYPKRIPEEDLPELFSNADFLLFPYRNIYGSGALLLAYTYGKPVIASDIPAFCEETDEGKTGILFASEDPQALADGILKAVACSEEQMEKYQQAIRELVSVKYNWKTSAAKTAGVYKNR